jgi:preprotein translocase subunit SecA
MGDRVGRSLKGLFGSRNERMVRELGPLLARVNELESWAKGLEAPAFKEQVRTWKAEVQGGQRTLEDVLPECFALVREAARRTLGLRHFDVQIVGGVVLHRGMIAEMMTGEGKTLVATLPLALNALAGKPVYLVTVNDYLARRDAAWMGPIYDYLGLAHGAIQSQMESVDRLPIYRSDIVYGTNNEFGFDYLRDNMKTRVEEQVQKHLAYAIVDEVDSILIDEARTPLIISGQAELMPDKYKAADQAACTLEKVEHFEVKEKERSVTLTEKGIEAAEKLLGVDSFYVAGNTDWPHYLENALRARHLYERDREYVVENGEVVIVDEFTGRKMTGRRWSDGLHQAVECKEGVRIRPENQTLATITFQNYFRLYAKLAGMTGTAMTEAAEFHKIYRLDVVSIPTNLPMVRLDQVDVVFRTEPEKWKAIVEEIARVHEKGQPVLVGTTSVENSEKLAGMLGRRGIRHEVLNAKHHEREAHIVAMAGEKGAVTVSTNMAGRGTDIKLGGNFEHRLRQALEQAGLREGDPEHLVEIDKVREELRPRCDADEQEVLAQGGLYVLGTERHEARRIDNQLRGRSGRQGNVGESRFYLSLEDPLMRRFYKDWVKNAMERLGMKEGVPIESPMVTRAIEKAQKKVEDYYFEVRKSLLEYDEVMDEQRKTIYSVRQEVLRDEGLREKVMTMFEGVMPRMAAHFAQNPEGFGHWFARAFGFELAREAAQKATAEEPDSTPALAAVEARYAEREAQFGPELGRRIERTLLLHAIDQKWTDHLRAITALRQGIGLRGYGQRDPKNEYKAEGFQLFQKLLAAVEDEVTTLVLRVQVGPPPGASGAAGAGAPSGPPLAARPAQDGAVRGPLPAGATPARPPTAEELQAAQALALARMRQNALRSSATGAFDALRRRQAADAAREAASAQAQEGAKPIPASVARERAYEGVGRNEDCPCGSGKKFKKCHGASA